jgi:hypothetical protein
MTKAAPIPRDFRHGIFEIAGLSYWHSDVPYNCRIYHAAYRGALSGALLHLSTANCPVSVQFGAHNAVIGAITVQRFPSIFTITPRGGAA